MGVDTLFVELSLILTKISTEIDFSVMAVEIELKIWAGPNLCNVLRCRVAIC